MESSEYESGKICSVADAKEFEEYMDDEAEFDMHIKDAFEKNVEVNEDSYTVTLGSYNMDASRPAEKHPPTQRTKRGTNRRAGPCVPPRGNTHRNAQNEAQPVGRGLASRREAIPTTRQQTRHNHLF